MKILDPLRYLNEKYYKEFDNHKAARGVNITAGQAKKLSELVSLLPADKNMLLYIWRFVFGIEINTIRRYTKIEHANGVIEALRFTCQRYLGLDNTISNQGMAKVFEPLMPDYEIIFVSAKKGICWFSGKSIDAVEINKAVDSIKLR